MKAKVDSLRMSRKIMLQLDGQRKTEQTQIAKIRNEGGDITTNTNSIEIRKIIREYYEQLHSNKLDVLDEQIPRKTKLIKTNLRGNRKCESTYKQ